MDKVKKWFFEDEYDEDEELFDTEEDVVEEVETAKPTSVFEKAKSAKASDTMRTLSQNKENHLILFEPRAYSETQEIASYLKQKRATVVNLHRLQKEQSKRVVDFLSGVIYAIDGDIQQIGPKIFLCAPKNISVGGSISLDDIEEGE